MFGNASGIPENKTKAANAKNKYLKSFGRMEYARLKKRIIMIFIRLTATKVY